MAPITRRRFNRDVALALAAAGCASTEPDEPLRPTNLLVITADDLGRRDLSSYGLSGIIGNSPAIRKVFEIVRAAAPTDATVLILGENGTGKELIARCLHQTGARRDGAFVALNCAAIAETLLESELFGHVKGAFTGATSDRQGKFEAANTGTIFLDEVGDLSALAQAKLLRVLQEKTLERVGSNSPVELDLRTLTCAEIGLSAGAA